MQVDLAVALKSVLIGVSIRICMNLSIAKTGSSMNFMIAAAWFGYNGELLSAEALVYYASAILGGAMGTLSFHYGLLAWKAGGSKGKKKKVD